MSLYQPSDAIARVSRSSLRPAGGAVPAGAVSLGMGEPDFDTPPVIVEAAVEALEHGWTHYGDLNGDPQLRAFIAELASEESGAQYTSEAVAITHGGAAAITAVMLATVNPGDQVVIPEPAYSLYADAVRLAGGEPVFVPTLANNQLDVEAVLEAAQGARLITVCNPVNPTGAVFTRESLERLGAGLAGTDTLVLADEAYAHLVYTDTFVSMLAIETLRERLIYCQTLSKTYAMTGWRIGYVIAEPELTKWIRHVHRTMNSSVNAAVQRAALTALQQGPSVSQEMFDAYRQRRDYVVSRLEKIPGISFTAPDGAFYVLFRYPQNLPSQQMLERFKDHGVILRAGSEYGPSGEGQLRLSFAADLETLETALDRIAEGIAEIDGGAPQPVSAPAADQELIHENAR